MRKVRYFETKYGYFKENGDFVVTTPTTPVPWVHILTNGRYGAVYSQAGSGYSFYIDASRSLVTRWIQDLVEDRYGKYIYIVDEDRDEVFSATFQPVRRGGRYETIYSPGKVVFQSSFERLDTTMNVVVTKTYDVEVMKLEIRNKTKDEMHLSIFSYFELNMGTSTDVHREFHKLFFETTFVANSLISEKYMWTAGPKSWNSSYPFTVFHSSSEEITSFETDKRNFIGMYRDFRFPRVVEMRRCTDTVGRNIDAVNALHIKLNLKPFSKETVYFILGIAENREKAIEISQKFQNKTFCELQIEETVNYWREFLSRFRTSLPDKDIEFLLNKWLPYQAIGGRLMARTAYYQMGGAFGYRDQLQDSLAALWLDPSITKNQILLHSEHQKKDGTVQHWWLPFSNEAPFERWSDDLLWLPFVVCMYIEHTGDKQILLEETKFLDGGKASIKEHCLRSIHSVLTSVSKRGVPLILDGDWNDGLNGLGQDKKGESFWLCEFLYFIINKVLNLFDLTEKEKDWLNKAAQSLKETFNKYAWNGEWFNRATSDGGNILGGKEDKRIFLNPQTWAVISNITDQSKMFKAMESLKQHLITDYGPLLLYPSFTEVNENVGYITRYAPGSRENGGVYTHAATWVMWAAWILKDCELIEKVYQTLSPILRYYKNPDTYMAEPYVTPGNSDGPLSPMKGRGGWTWYTGSASWFYNLIIRCYLGIYPTSEGILFFPCSKKKWRKAYINFQIRDANYSFQIFNPNGKELHQYKKIVFNGKEMDGNLIPYNPGENQVEILY